MMIEDDIEYQNHAIFKELDQYIDFYNSLSTNVFSYMTQGTKSICNIDSYVYSSLKGTLESIKNTLKNGRINDAWALMRKYHDSIIINIYSNLYLKNNFNIENLVVQQIDNWLNCKDSLPEFRIMSRYIRDVKSLENLRSLVFEKDDRYKKIRDRCNNNMHYNFFSNIILNDNEIHLPNRVKKLNVFSFDLKDLFCLHISYMFSIKEHYMSSSDYIDYLECGMQPPENSQYWVAPFVQEALDEILAKHRPDIMQYLRQNTCMQIE